MIVYILFVVGFIVLIAGAHFLIKGASSLGLRLGLSQLVIGLTIVSLGTSLPELIINVFASINGNTGLAIGNVIGSNITNTLLIVGTAALIYPIKVNKIVVKRDIWINLLAIVILLLLANDFIFGRPDNTISKIDGLILLGFFTYYAYLSFYKSGPSSKETGEQKIKTMTLFLSVVLTLSGIAGLYFGGKWIVAGIQKLSSDFGISESVLGLTLVAGATSLPELVTSVLAALKKNVDIALGNAIGSNIFNIFLVLGVSAVIKPIDFETGLNIQIGLLVLASLMLLMYIRTGKESRTISRTEGTLLLLGYFAFLYISIFMQS